MGRLWFNYISSRHNLYLSFSVCNQSSVFAVRFVVEKPQIMSASQNVVVSETTRSSIIPNNNSSSQKLPPGLISISKKKLLKNIDIINGGGQRINAWVDSMRASSPTHLKSLPSSISSQQQLNSWIVSFFNSLSQTDLDESFSYISFFSCMFYDRCNILQH